MVSDRFKEIFTEDALELLFPESRSDEFFDALYGDAEEGAYDIKLAYVSSNDDMLEFELRLTQRPGKCLACNLTYGLPEVFSRHPLINIKGLAKDIENLSGGHKISSWKIGHTREKSRQLHTVPLIFSLEA
ncbi:MAG: pancreas/duodenum homeobox protein 1 [Proteobacteria bacterium]|nr:pancreas/duodenum homeobox protein 1 [Pseudomonadota bacterium]